MPIPITLQINCGYARVAIRELSSPERMKSRLEVAHEQRRQDFLQLFSSEKFTIPEEYRSSTNRQFNKHCDKILDYFSSKWHPPSKRLEYLSVFSPENWKHLTTSEMEKHTLSSCTACYINHQSLQECFPGKPVFIPPSIISLPECERTIRSEKSMTRKVLGELNSLWEEQYSHSFTSQLPRNAPEENLTRKLSRSEKKKQDRNKKRAIVQQISQHMKENTAMSVLAEAQSLSSYNRKRLALGFEKPSEPSKKHKSHSPSDSSLTWDVDSAILELQSFPEDETINWSQMARKYSIPQKNGGQVLKEVAKQRGIDVDKLDNRGDCTQRIRRKKKLLEGKFLRHVCLQHNKSQKTSIN